MEIAGKAFKCLSTVSVIFMYFNRVAYMNFKYNKASVHHSWNLVKGFHFEGTRITCLALMYLCRWLFTQLTQANQQQKEFGKISQISIFG